MFNTVCSNASKQDFPEGEVIHCESKEVVESYFMSAVKEVRLLKYIEDITRRCEDMNFIFEWLKQYFTNERSE